MTALTTHDGLSRGSALLVMAEPATAAYASTHADLQTRPSGAALLLVLWWALLICIVLCFPDIAASMVAF